MVGFRYTRRRRWLGGAAGCYGGGGLVVLFPASGNGGVEVLGGMVVVVWWFFSSFWRWRGGGGMVVVVVVLFVASNDGGVEVLSGMLMPHTRSQGPPPLPLTIKSSFSSSASEHEGVNLDARYLQVFPFSLAGRAAVWFDSQPSGTFTTWAGLRDAFLAKYFPPAKASRLHDQIHSFCMEPDEPYHLAWERFQTFISRCSQHGLSDWALVEKFYNGLTPEIRARFDTSAGGQLMGKKTVNECNDLFESFAHSDMDYSTTSRTSIPVRTSSAGRGVNQVSLDPSVAAVLEGLKQELSKIKKKVDRCEVCRGGHDTIDCPTLTLEQVEYIAGQSRGPTNLFNNSNYNSNWRGNGNNSGFRSSGNPPGFPSGQYQNRGPGLYVSSGSGQSGPFSGSGSSGQFANGGSNQESQGSGKALEGSLSRMEEMFTQMMT
ncbi:uncharacterized protein LOC110928838 [Helianthus annuus]|uniref:uncharacterized protein LOC110928838 n=1 Tax=Helianthus annuus TaxID=4232 RepID=UPI000B8FF144|nr:uncharacterized protein LOC110928838 [Helianthus annuus]